MLRSMFGMGGTEILVILIVALLFLGPDKLPDAAKKISKGIRDIKKQSRILQRTIEDDEHIGGAIRDLKSALRGDEEPVRPKPIKPPKQLVEPSPTPALPETVTQSGAAIPEPGTAEHAGAVGAAALAVDPHAEASGLGSDEHTLRGVLAPTPSAEPGSSALAEPGSTASASATAELNPPAPAERTPTPAEPIAHTHEPTLRGIVAPTEPGEEPRLTLPPTAGEPDDDAPATTRGDDAVLAALVKPAPHTIPRSSSPPVASSSPASPASPAAAEPADKPESKHG